MYYNPYNTYNPTGYFQPGQQNFAQPYQQNTNSMPTVQQQNNGLPIVLQVSNIKQVEQAQVQPGGKALVLVANEPVIAMRAADNMGLTTTDYYHINKFDPDAETPVNAGDFVQREEFNKTVQSIVQEIQKLQQSAPAAPTKKGEKV